MLCLPYSMEYAYYASPTVYYVVSESYENVAPVSWFKPTRGGEFHDDNNGDDDIKDEAYNV